MLCTTRSPYNVPSDSDPAKVKLVEVSVEVTEQLPSSMVSEKLAQPSILQGSAPRAMLVHVGHKALSTDKSRWRRCVKIRFTTPNLSCVPTGNRQCASTAKRVVGTCA